MKTLRFFETLANDPQKTRPNTLKQVFKHNPAKNNYESRRRFTDPGSRAV